MRILVVEDDIQVADLLSQALVNRRYVVDLAHDGETAWLWVQETEYDLILLDVTLPKLDGLQLCHRLRNRNFTLPVLMLTARDSSADKISGLDAGADDYMVKPFDLEELMARIRALLRRGGSTQPPLRWGNLTLNPSMHEVDYDDQPLTLTPKEFALLELLVSNGRQLISRFSIVEQIWSLDSPPTQEAIKTHIRGLRQKLRAAGAPNDIIETVHGLGYRMKQH